MTHPTPSLRLLAIDPGTRYLGVAVFEGARLLDWRVRVMAANCRHAPDLVQQVEASIRPLIQRYQPRVLVLKTCSASQRRQSRMVPVVAASLHRLGTQQGLLVSTYTPEQVSRSFSPDRRVTRLELARIIATEHYPFLARFYEHERKKAWYRERYYLRMFAAVALGLVASRDVARLPAPRD
jgi:hypothetical protein